MKQQKILVVLPHPDDEAFGLSGTLAKHISEGAHVTYACLTLGEMGRNMGIPPFANRITLPAFRKQELINSCDAIGIQDVRMLGFHDKMIEFEPEDLLDKVITALLDELTPDIVYTFYPRYSVHPDHDASGAAVVRCIERMGKEDMPQLLCIAFSRQTEQDLGKADVKVDVRPFLQQKIDSIKAHQSQFQAPELFGKQQLSQQELEQRFGSERFWTYPLQGR